MENPKDKIYSILNQIASEMGAEDIIFKVEKPKDDSHGDFASNIALVLSATLGGRGALRSHFELDESSNASAPAELGVRLPSATLAKKSSRQNTPRAPMEIAEEIVKILNSKFLNINSDFDKVEAVKPGFINFYLSQKYLQVQVESILREGESFGSLSLGKGKKASVEFVSANPTGPLHIGNARGGPLGDVIANVLTKAGYEVIREYLHNDVGGQVDRLGEAIYFTLHPDQKSETYQMQYQGEYLQELAEQIEEALGSEDGLSQEEFIEKAGKLAVELMLTDILKDCKNLDISFDKITKESNLRKEVPQALEKIKAFLKENEGALWFAPNDEFLKDRETVVKKSDGNYTYFASDIAYHNLKMSQNDLVIDVLGSNHSGHVPRILAVINALGYKTENFRCILYQYVRLKRGAEIVKMSKRAGTFVTAREVLDEVGKDAFRFFLLMANNSTHMDFDLELAKKKASDNPVFYVQYAYTRIASIFKKTEVKDFEGADTTLLKEAEEIALIRKLILFPELVEEVSQSFNVNLLANYSLDLASLFHKFYEKHQVISKEGKVEGQRLALLKATQITLKNTLDLLGVSAPESM